MNNAFSKKTLMMWQVRAERGLDSHLGGYIPISLIDLLTIHARMIRRSLKQTTLCKKRLMPLQLHVQVSFEEGRRQGTGVK